ncbi:hypothetical protein [Paraburkholderia lycopersici]|uniref:Uncharacterized protein n=1 Tax=Paraburkholderia lycopersici TaxID=416944 RepID=A0A1G6X6F3_9BURK|nr:hypothetical protein [Paraburkholderia lycopersici]SDD72886.1 hypothetical protein SAMN05421548_12467 [Paraburkholderia lycopersici]
MGACRLAGALPRLARSGTRLDATRPNANRLPGVMQRAAKAAPLELPAGQAGGTHIRHDGGRRITTR